MALADHKGLVLQQETWGNLAKYFTHVMEQVVGWMAGICLAVLVTVAWPGLGLISHSLLWPVWNILLMPCAPLWNLSQPSGRGYLKMARLAAALEPTI